MNLIELLSLQTAVRPASLAIIDTCRGRARTITFAELDLESRRVASLLNELGLRPGDSVLLLQPMSAELYIVLIALFRLGLVAMFLDPSAGREHIERCCELQPPRGLVAGPKAHLLRLMSPALREIPVKLSTGSKIPGAMSMLLAKERPPHSQAYPCESDSPALLTFTSGSTGQPKAALRTHGFLLAQHRALQASLGLTPGEIDLTTLPIFVLTNLACGVTSLIPDADLRVPGAINAAPVVNQILSHRPTTTAASPALVQRIADYCAPRRQTLPGFRKIFTGGAPVFPKLLKQLQAIAPRADVIAVYGSTEAEPIAHISLDEMRPEDHEAMRSGCGLLAGRPVPEIALRILCQQWGKPLGPLTLMEFEENCLPAGEPGEVVVSGDHVLQGYLHGQDESETKFDVDGIRWHRTGDAGYLDNQGRLWLLGRCAARIEDGRGELYPFTVECAAHHHPAVRRAAVVSYKGKRVLVVELSGNVSVASLAPLVGSLAWAHIDEIRPLRHIPVDRRHNAKTDYPALREILKKSR